MQEGCNGCTSSNNVVQTSQIYLAMCEGILMSIYEYNYLGTFGVLSMQGNILLH